MRHSAANKGRALLEAQAQERSGEALQLAAPTASVSAADGGQAQLEAQAQEQSGKALPINAPLAPTAVLDAADTVAVGSALTGEADGDEALAASFEASLRISEESAQVALAEPRTQAEPLPTASCISSSDASRGDFVIICVWALGGDESNFAETVEEFSNCKNVSFVFVIPPRETEWYRYLGGTMASLHHQDSQKINEDDFVSSSRAVQAEITRQAERLGTFEQIFLLSYSQGGTIAMDAAMELDQKLGGVLLLRTTVMQLSFATFAARNLAPKQFPVLVTGARRANRVYTMEETDRIFERLCDQGWNARYHVFSVGHGAEWSEEELDYIHEHLRSWMDGSLQWKHDRENWGPAWAAKPKHAGEQSQCAICIAKGKGLGSSLDSAVEDTMKPHRRIVGKKNCITSSSTGGSSSKPSGGYSAARSGVRS
eukprot:TRINITY_DN31364_c0_g2_i1.p1 TRINITY_DN31364_c0_g2~~TRINITY_DN31364_c0_g2_i1.p1  ORF type:complete len:428 (-),score=79.02 TRINITY_DN31364_c0_g2_i1:107-1390(-)